MASTLVKDALDPEEDFTTITEVHLNRENILLLGTPSGLLVYSSETRKQEEPNEEEEREVEETTVKEGSLTNTVTSLLYKRYIPGGVGLIQSHRQSSILMISGYQKDASPVRINHKTVLLVDISRRAPFPISRYYSSSGQEGMVKRAVGEAPPPSVPFVLAKRVFPTLVVSISFNDLYVFVVNGSRLPSSNLEASSHPDKEENSIQGNLPKSQLYEYYYPSLSIFSNLNGKQSGLVLLRQLYLSPHPNPRFLRYSTLVSPSRAEEYFTLVKQMKEEREEIISSSGSEFNLFDEEEREAENEDVEKSNCTVPLECNASRRRRPLKFSFQWFQCHQLFFPSLEPGGVRIFTTIQRGNSSEGIETHGSSSGNDYYHFFQSLHPTTTLSSEGVGRAEPSKEDCLLTLACNATGSRVAFLDKETESLSLYVVVPDTTKVHQLLYGSSGKNRSNMEPNTAINQVFHAATLRKGLITGGDAVLRASLCLTSLPSAVNEEPLSSRRGGFHRHYYTTSYARTDSTVLEGVRRREGTREVCVFSSGSGTLHVFICDLELRYDYHSSDSDGDDNDHLQRGREIPCNTQLKEVTLLSSRHIKNKELQHSKVFDILTRSAYHYWMVIPDDKVLPREVNPSSEERNNNNNNVDGHLLLDLPFFVLRYNENKSEERNLSRFLIHIDENTNMNLSSDQRYTASLHCESVFFLES